MVYAAVWAGLRAAELAGLQVGDVELSPAPLDPNAPAKSGALRVERTAATVRAASEDAPSFRYDTTRTRGSRRRVPLTPAMGEVLADYLAAHPRASEPGEPLLPVATFTPQKPTGLRATDADGRRVVPTAEEALAAMSVPEAERLVLDWAAPVRHGAFYKAIYRPAVYGRTVVARGSRPG